MDRLVSSGFKVGGIITYEVRRAGVRVGFKVMDISSGDEGWLAHVDQPVGPRIGKYRVNLKDLNRVAVKAILKSILDADLIVIDEIGPMELCSESFRDAVLKAFNSGKPVLGTVHRRLKRSFLADVDKKEIVTVTFRNRDVLPEEISEKIIGSRRCRLGEDYRMGMREAYC